MLGTRVSHYTIVDKLGAGGMGVVYAAEDTRLGRKVALKFLPHDLTRSDEARERFTKEARAASALDHPNICTVHEIDQTNEGQLYICMTLYQGETLYARLGRGPLELHASLDLGLQIVQGLRSAHETGIVHRDIKPANVMITTDGAVKLLDFGLAKLTGQTGITRTGTTLGTVAYMSPEQARGNGVDHRTDLWSVGVILYEMLAGVPPFRGDKGHAVVYAILHEQPEPVTAVRSGVPLEYERIIAKCLEKRPQHRYQSAADLEADLRRLRRDLDTGPTTAVPSASLWAGARRQWVTARVRRVAGYGLAAAVGGVLALGAVALWRIGAQDERAGEAVTVAPAAETAFTPLTAGGGVAGDPDLSPDGERIVYSADDSGSLDLWVRPVSGGQPVRLTAEPDNERHPAWSPDGATIAYASDADGGGLCLIPSAGGGSHRLRDHRGEPIRGTHPAWSPDGRFLLFQWVGDLYVVPFAGGEPRPVLTGTGGTVRAAWGPDGRSVVAWNRARGDLQLVRLDGGDARDLGLVPSGEEVAGLAWSRDGRWLYYCRGPFGGNKSLWRVALDAAGAPFGASRPLTNALTDVIDCSLAPGGRSLAFTRSHVERHLWLYDREPASGLAAGEGRRLTSRGVRNYYPALSPDGNMVAWTSHSYAKGVLQYCELPDCEVRRVTQDWSHGTRETTASFTGRDREIVFSSTAGGSYEIVRVPAPGSVALPVTETDHPIRDVGPSCSIVRREVAFYSNRAGSFDIWVQALDGAGGMRQLTDWSSSEIYPAWSPDGQRIVFRTDREGSADLWVMDADGGNPRPYVVHPAEEGWGSWSPDGRWFYFTSDRGGRFELWVMPAKGGAARRVPIASGVSTGLPDAALYTRFAVSETRLVVPVESRSGDVYLMDVPE